MHFVSYQLEWVFSRQVSEGDFACHFESNESSETLLNTEVPSCILSVPQLPLRRGVGLLYGAVTSGASWCDSFFISKGLVKNWHLLPSWVFKVLCYLPNVVCPAVCYLRTSLCENTFLAEGWELNLASIPRTYVKQCITQVCNTLRDIICVMMTDVYCPKLQNVRKINLLASSQVERAHYKLW